MHFWLTSASADFESGKSLFNYSMRKSKPGLLQTGSYRLSTCWRYAYGVTRVQAQERLGRIIKRLRAGENA